MDLREVVCDAGNWIDLVQDGTNGGSIRAVIYLRVP